MIKAKLLISGLGGSMFPYLHEKLFQDFELVYVDNDPSLKFIYPNLNFVCAPLVTSNEYPPFIKGLIRKEGINVYIPLIDEEILVAHKISLDLKDLILISPESDFCRLCLNKLELMHKLEELDISVIESYKGSELKLKTSYPVFVKPIVGRGSRGIRKINSYEEFNAYILLEKYNPDDILVQNYISGQEYTVGVLANNLNQIICIGVREVESKKGITIKAKTVINNEIMEKVKLVNKLLRPAGPYNIQLFIDVLGKIKIFEINPRFSTTTVMNYYSEIDVVSLYLEYYNEEYKNDILIPFQNLALRRTWKNNFYG